MKKIKNTRLVSAVFIIVIILAVIMLASCVRLEFTPVSIYSPTPAPEYSEAPPSPTPAPTMPDASANKPLYDGTDRPRYNINVKFDEDSHSTSASQTVVYTNTAADSMNELYMHIYPNHFSKQEYVDMSFMDEPSYFNDEFDPGNIEIGSVKAAGKTVEFEVRGEEETILRILLETPLLKGSSIELSLEYTLKVPHRIGRYAWGDVGTSFCNWYPIMAMYDRDGWNLDKYYEIGDPFYSETADYAVTIDMPEGMQAAFTGDVLSDTASDGRRVLSLAETGVRDFAFVLSREYVIGADTVDGIEVRVAIPKDDEEYMDDVMGYATKSLSVYGRYFGKYTNDTFTVAFSDFESGMEYPGIVLISAKYLDDEELGLFIVENVVAHEIGHQWWYSAVGNDEIDEAWLDEGLTSFTEMVYYSEDYGWDTASVLFTPAERIEGLPLDSSLAAFSGWDDYVYVYTFGRTFFKTLMDKMGKDEFFTMLQKYYATYAYGIATAEDLRSLVAETGNSDALEWYDECVYGS